MKDLIRTVAAAPAFEGASADTPVYSTEAGAIDGYDPLSYFSDGSAEPGSADITAERTGSYEWR